MWGMGMYGDFGFAGWLPMVLFAILLAIGFNLIAGRMGKSRVLWTVLALVPVVNVFFYVYAWFAIVIYILDRLNALAGKPQA